MDGLVPWRHFHCCFICSIVREACFQYADTYLLDACIRVRVEGFARVHAAGATLPRLHFCFYVLINIICTTQYRVVLHPYHTHMYYMYYHHRGFSYAYITCNMRP
jgi:hypothetical protein